ADRYATGRELADDLRNAVAGLMTEDDWLACTDPLLMLSHLHNLNHSSAVRKMRLFACACVRQTWKHLTDPRSRQALEGAERLADGQATDAELWAAYTAVAEATTHPATQAVDGATDESAWTAAMEASRTTARHIQCALLHDLFGPLLFRQVLLDPGWLDRNDG